MKISGLAAIAAAVILALMPTSVGANQGPRRVEILKAVYGPRRAGGVDVTYRLQNQVNCGRFSLSVGNGLFRCDPAPGYAKSLWVTYRVGYRKFYAVLGEGALLNF